MRSLSGTKKEAKRRAVEGENESKKVSKRRKKGPGENAQKGGGW